MNKEFTWALTYHLIFHSVRQAIPQFELMNLNNRKQFHNWYRNFFLCRKCYRTMSIKSLAIGTAWQGAIKIPRREWLPRRQLKSKTKHYLLIYYLEFRSHSKVKGRMNMNCGMFLFMGPEVISYKSVFSFSGNVKKRK